MIIIIQAISLFLIAWIAPVTLIRACAKQNIPAVNFIIFAIGVVGFVLSMGWLG